MTIRYFQKRTLKTRNSKRYVPLPDFIMDELYLARARYEETLKNDPEFDENLDFVLFRITGRQSQDRIIILRN